MVRPSYCELVIDRGAGGRHILFHYIFWLFLFPLDGEGDGVKFLELGKQMKKINADAIAHILELQRILDASGWHVKVGDLAVADQLLSTVARDEILHEQHRRPPVAAALRKIGGPSLRSIQLLCVAAASVAFFLVTYALNWRAADAAGLIGFVFSLSMVALEYAETAACSSRFGGL
jgi:hypothetical protein